MIFILIGVENSFDNDWIAACSGEILLGSQYSSVVAEVSTTGRRSRVFRNLKIGRIPSSTIEVLRDDGASLFNFDVVPADESA